MAQQELGKLHPLERAAYWIIWVSGVAYSVYKVFTVGQFFQHNFYTEDFTTGWFLQRKKDVSDYEWNTFIPLFKDLAPWIVIHLIFSEIFRYFSIKLLPLWYIILSTAYSIQYFGLACVITIFVQPIIFWLVAKNSRNKALTWITSMVIMYLVNTDPNFKNWFGLVTENRLLYMLTVSQMWVHIRCLSFCLDVQSGTAEPSLQHLLAFCFYLPLYFCGPIVLYKEFRASMEQQYTPWTLNRISNFLFNLVRYLFWLVVTEVWIHFIYTSALIYQPKVVRQFDGWTLYGMGYCMGQFFMAKYAVMYGLPGTWARAEGVPAPQPPKCIARIHLYSEMWRTFDEGLYKFLTRHIYIPILGSRRSLLLRAFASAMCFGFVYIWHGTMEYILIWSVLNYFGIMVEMLGRTISHIPSFQAWQNRWFGPKGIRRFNAIITSPLFYMSAVSNFYFFGGVDIGNIYVARAFLGLASSTLVALLFLYCCCHVAVEVKLWEQQRAPATHKNLLE